MTTSTPANEQPVHPAIVPLPQGALAAGVDILEVDRMRRCMDSSRFMRRVFSKEELEYNSEFKELFKNFYTSYIQSLYDNKLYDEGIKNIQSSFQVLDVVYIYISFFFYYCF